ncbi:MAG: DUF349 domain-containing protein [Bacteroidaceae bacterium]|nr:DUF349 domain-containing protein [Bacteroidaceae bacterium]
MENVTDPRTDELQEQPTVEQPVETPAPAEQPAAEEEVKTPNAEEPETPAEPEEPAPVEELETLAEPEEPAPAEEPETLAEPEEPAPEEEPATLPTTKEGIVECITAIAASGDAGSRASQEQLKQAFYRLQREERAKALADFVAAGGNAEEFTPDEDPLEEELKAQLAILKEVRAKQIEDNEKKKEANLARKRAIIEEIKAISTSPEEANKAYDTFRKLQAEWKEIKPIPESAANEVWKQFQFCQDQFYDLLKTNSALRDYDFKKNFEAKTRLCEAAEQLIEEPDIIRASHALQQLHQEFREIGPVAKEVREELWDRFKTASTAVNKRHAQYFDSLKEKEEENLAKKTAICEEIEAIETDNINGYAQWEGLTKQIIALQEEWKTIGRATKKMNTKIFERFRAACDNFFSKKAEYFKEQKKTYAENAARKLALVEQAEALKESTQWTATTNQLIQLQKEWKEIGATAHKTSNALWDRFNAACNEFFDKKKTVLGDQHKEESENLVKKKTVIEKLEALAIEGGEDVGEAVRQLQDEWNSIGHVPFKNKDKIYAKYREVVDKLYKEFNLRAPRRTPGAGSKSQSSSALPLHGGAGRGSSLLRLYEARKAELATYENNISFLTTSSKKGSALIDTMMKKIETLKANLAELADRIRSEENPAPAEKEAAATEAPAEETPQE